MGCALGKNTKRPFGSNASRSKEILDLTHSDVCGPMTPKSLGGHLYYVTFIDDHSRKTWVYLMKTKDEVFTKFPEFKVEMENLTERRIKLLRSDSGGEYTSKEIIAFCKEFGIKRELIVPYNSEQNGVAERKNRSIEESVKAMLHNQDLPKFLWGEATKTVVYIQNQSPTALKKSKELPVDSDDEELSVFEEEIERKAKESHLQEEGPSEPIQPMVILETRKRPNWLKSTLLDAEGHGAAKGSLRESNKPKRYFGYAAYMKKLIEAKPSTFEEAINHQEWKDAMNEKYQSIMKNGVWEVVTRPEDKSVVTSKWIYKIKHAADGSIDKNKARFVARDFSQQEGIDYEETFAPTARYTTIRSLVSLAPSM
eukprot:PITA_12749